MIKVNEIFYSVQGEGCFTGVPSVFIRFSKCNLKCPFCDTDFQDFKAMTEKQIVDEVYRLGKDARHVVITGGEPTLQLTDTLCDLLHQYGYEIEIETNGTNKVSEKVDFVTCSPKFEYCQGAELKVERIDQLKVVYDGKNDMSRYNDIKAKHRCLQPCDTGDRKKNKEILSATISYCLAHPQWNISLQIQKILNVR